MNIFKDSGHILIENKRMSKGSLPAQPQLKNITISRVEEEDIDVVLPYVIEFRKQLFPMLDSNKLPKDLLAFSAVYLEAEAAEFLQAKDHRGNLIGVVGMSAYDYRFPHLDIDRRKTVEVARLFVDPSYRRSGLGTALFKSLVAVAKEKSIERLYLHTHPFLTGAYEFWGKQGFQLKDYCNESNFPTIHMELFVDRIA
ncbi:GNAT family N-acetyltransferase [Sphingobacterium thalpophilum]|uniref:GNAT family N-acetyltransferase n=1 Tax=Sphingobacterium thalpophilum TaxID=259 RepID=A0ACD5C1J5_9SPHI